MLGGLRYTIKLMSFDAVAGYGACVEIGMVKGIGAIFAANLQPWIRAFFSLSLTTNLLTTREYLRQSCIVSPAAFFPHSRLYSRARAFGSGSGRSRSVALTTFSPVLIAARIMWMNSRVKSYRSGGGHWEVVETLVQSAAVYSAALASLLGTYLAGSNAQYVCLDILQPLIVSPASDVVVIV